MIKLIECPRDAIQGVPQFIPTAEKARYINQLLKVGFDTLDFGSFVSPKAIPQLQDTAEVLKLLDLSDTVSKLLAIVANPRGGRMAASCDEISYLGYPFSISETFQLRNTNSSIEESLSIAEEMNEICFQSRKKLVVYISMGFGNPYGDAWGSDIVSYWIQRLSQMGIDIFAISDTIGVASPESIRSLFQKVLPEFPLLEIGAHFHTTPDQWENKFIAALEAGCKRFDGAIKGFGGCPMAKDELTGNMATENMIAYLLKNGFDVPIDQEELKKTIRLLSEIMPLN